MNVTEEFPIGWGVGALSEYNRRVARDRSYRPGRQRRAELSDTELATVKDALAYRKAKASWPYIEEKLGMSAGSIKRRIKLWQKGE